jgi:hypothetical protein
LTAAQQALAEILEVDSDLLAGAGMGSAAAPEAEISRQEMDKWIDALPRDEVNSILQQLLEGKGQQAERSIKNRLAGWRRGLNTDRTEASRRTVGELRQNAEKACQIRLEVERIHGRSHAAQGADSTYGEGRHLEGSIKDEHAISGRNAETSTTRAAVQGGRR